MEDRFHGKVILDLGTGTGDLLFQLQEAHTQKLQLIGVDFSLPMLKEAAVKRKGKEFISFLQADARNLPMATSSVDAVVSAFVMRNIKRVLDRSLLEMWRVLRPGGKLELLEMYVPSGSLLKALHRVYLKTVLPMLGRSICKEGWSGDYLSQTIFNFGTPKEFSLLLEKTGFQNISYKTLLGGVAVLHTAHKCS